MSAFGCEGSPSPACSACGHPRRFADAIGVDVRLRLTLMSAHYYEMSLPLRNEFQVGRIFVRVAAAAMDLPGVTGWVGTWHIYHLPWRPGDAPIRYGDTGLLETAELALATAGTAARLVARLL